MPVKSSMARRSTCGISLRFAMGTGSDQHRSRGTESAAALLTVLRHGGASTLEVVNGVKKVAPKDRGTLPAELQDYATLRSVAVRARGGYRSCLAKRSSRPADRAHDSAVPRKLAQHADRLPFDSPFDSHLSHRPGISRGDHQRDDSRRAGAGGRNSGGRCDGGDRKRPPQHGNAREDAGSRDSGRRAADRRAGVCFHAVHLHRLRAGAHAVRRGEVPVYAAGNGGGVRDADVLPVNPNGGADARSLSAAVGDGRCIRRARKRTRPRDPRA